MARDRIRVRFEPLLVCVFCVVLDRASLVRAGRCDVVLTVRVDGPAVSAAPGALGVSATA